MDEPMRTALLIFWGVFVYVAVTIWLRRQDKKDKKRR